MENLPVVDRWVWTNSLFFLQLFRLALIRLDLCNWLTWPDFFHKYIAICRNLECVQNFWTDFKSGWYVGKKVLVWGRYPGVASHTATTMQSIYQYLYKIIYLLYFLCTHLFNKHPLGHGRRLYNHRLLPKLSLAFSVLFSLFVNLQVGAQLKLLYIRGAQVTPTAFQEQFNFKFLPKTVYIRKFWWYINCWILLMGVLSCMH